MKIQRFKSDPTKNWKTLKAVHMKMRFIDYFIQLFDYGHIKDVKRMNPAWDEFKQEFLKTSNFKKTLIKFNSRAN